MQKGKRLVYLDCLRGLAAVIVVVFHMIFLADPHLDVPWWCSWFKVGGVGVTIFFIISAFSLSLTMPRHLLSSRPLLSFYLHRLFRVLPLFYFVLVVTILFFIDRGRTFYLQQILLNIFCLFNVVPGQEASIVMAGWTIGVEVLFYALFPIVYKFRNKSGIVLVVSAIVGYLGERIFPFSHYMYSILRFFPVFMAGMIVFDLVNSRFAVILSGVRKRVVGKFVVILSIILFSFIVQNSVMTSDTVLLYLQVAVFSLMLFGLSFAEDIILIVSNVSQYLGKVSYSIYLLHPLVIVHVREVYPGLKTLNLGVSMTFVLCILVTMSFLLPVAHLSYHLIEKPGIDAGKFLIKRICENRIVADNTKPVLIVKREIPEE